MTTQRKTGRPVKVPGEKGTKEKIFDAAIGLFAERGYDGVSIRDIAKAVGIKESSVYKHYSGKDEILDSIFEYMKSRLYAPPAVDMDIMLDQLPLEEVLEAGMASLRQMIKDPYMVRAVRIVTIEMHRNKKIREFFLSQMFERPVDENEALFRRLIDKKKIRRLDPMALATAYFAFSIYMHMETFLLRYDEGIDAERIERKSRDQIRLFVEMLNPGEA